MLAACDSSRVNTLISYASCLGAACALDIIGALSMASVTTSFDYRFWPISRPRLASILFLAVTFILMVGLKGSDFQQPPHWPEALCFLALLAWGVALIRDWNAQRRENYHKPLRYSDRDE